MAGAVGSVETPRGLRRRGCRAPPSILCAGHPAGCRTLFDAPARRYRWATSRRRRRSAGSSRARWSARWTVAPRSRTPRGCGARARGLHPVRERALHSAPRRRVCSPRLGVHRELLGRGPPGAEGSPPATRCSASPPPSASATASSSRCPARSSPSRTSAVPGHAGHAEPELRAPGLALPHMHAPYRFFDGLAEDMIGYIFPRGNAVGIPGSTTPRIPPARVPTASAAGIPTTARRRRRRPPTCSGAHWWGSWTRTTGRRARRHRPLRPR